MLLVLQNPLLQRFLLAGSLQLQAGRLHQLQHLRFHIQDLLIVFTVSYFQVMDLVFFMQNWLKLAFTFPPAPALFTWLKCNHAFNKV